MTINKLEKRMTIAVIGAGNGGQAIAGHLASKGFRVKVYDRNRETVNDLNKTKEIQLIGAINAKGTIDFASFNLRDVLIDAEIIMIATTATAHGSLAIEMSHMLTEGQIIILNPGRTCGALEFRNVLDQAKVSVKVYVAEAQTLVYACRLIHNCMVNIIGVKDRVLLAALPSTDTAYVLDKIKPIFPCFYSAKSVLQTSFENIGAVFHPTVVLFNEATIERGESFYFYRDMTDGLARIIEQADKERLSVAFAYGISPISAFDWVSYAYNGVEGKNLCERMQNNPAYYEILAPKTIICRQITEDIPTGIIPLAELGRAAGVHTPLFDSLISICSILHKKDYRKDGRTLKRLGLEGLSAEEIVAKIQ